MIGTKDYPNWGWDLWDLGNQYVFIADQSGLIPLLCFLAIFVFGFKYLGITRVRFRGDRRQQFFVWAFGASLLANVVGFFGISYFDQTIVVWYAILAMIGAIYLQQPVAKTTKPQPAEAQVAASDSTAPELAYAAGAGELVDSDLLETDFEPREHRMYEI
jgi:O-antigen ligase